MSDNRVDLPPINSPNFLEKVRETLGVYLGNRGDALNRGVTMGDLYTAGIVNLSPGFLKGGKLAPISGPGASVTYTPDNTPPPTPTGFAATSAISNILIECDAQTYTVGHGHAKSALYGIVWNVGDPQPVFDNAQLVSEFPGSVHAYATNPATTWHLWLKWVSEDGFSSVIPAGGTHGVVVTTGLNVEKLVKAMTGPGNPFKIVSEPITLEDGTVVPVGTYTADAYIHNSQITNAKIANLAVDNAKIADLSVSKLTAGSMAVGAFIQSTNYVAGSVGWRISANGIAELSNAVVRGAVYANAGYIGNNTIDETGMQSSGYVQGASGWRLDSSGGFYAKSGTFSGTLSGATGSFSGNLSGSNIFGVNGTFTGTLRANIVSSGNMELNSATDLDAFGLSIFRNEIRNHYFNMDQDGPVIIFVTLIPRYVYEAEGGQTLIYPNFYYNINGSGQKFGTQPNASYLFAGVNAVNVYATHTNGENGIANFVVLKLYR